MKTAKKPEFVEIKKVGAMGWFLYERNNGMLTAIPYPNKKACIAALQKRVYVRTGEMVTPQTTKVTFE